MKATELRIGNTVNYDNKQVTIAWEDLRELYLKPIRYKKLYKPILLTEEWLLKFGFELKDNNLQDELLSTFFYHKNNVVDVEFGEGKLYWHDNYTSIYHQDILYVHQLQNLYFALTGKELKIKENV